MGRKSEESLKKWLKHGSGCIFIFSYFSRSSFFFPFPFPSYRVFDPFFLMFASSGDSRFAGGGGGWGTAQWVKCLLSLRIFIHTPRTCVKQKVLCAVSVFLLEWESDTGQSPEAWGPVSQAYAATNKRPQKDKGEKTSTQVSDHSNAHTHISHTHIYTHHLHIIYTYTQITYTSYTHTQKSPKHHLHKSLSHTHTHTSVLFWEPPLRLSRASVWPGHCVILCIGTWWFNSGYETKRQWVPVSQNLSVDNCAPIKGRTPSPT